MSRERECKILEIDTGDVVLKLENMGAEKDFEGEVISHVFDYEDRRLAKDGRLLRLRTMGDVATLTFKGAIRREQKAKVREEHELEVGDPETMRTILNELGLDEVARSGKHRVSFLLHREGSGNIRFELDTLPGIPTFLEVEAGSEEAMKSIVKELGFREHEMRPWTGRDVVNFYRKLDSAKAALRERQESS